MTGAEAAAFAEALTDAQARVAAALDRLIPVDATDQVCAAIRYAALGGGKRLRPFLAMRSAALFNADPAQADRVAAAVECVHVYSLIHDDLPAMDDDDMRHGKPTTHRAFDEALAVLAGDGLQALAFQILADPKTGPAEARARLCHGLATASGPQGMVGGQAMDIAAETAETPLTLPQVSRLQSLKTGALIGFAATSGAILADAGPEAEAALSAYAADLGLAFQIRDDLLDIEGDEAVAGKALRKDADAGKATFASLMGVETARARAAELVESAIAHLALFGDKAAPLALAAKFSLHRTH